MNSTLYFIRPHSPLVFRSGQPFGDIQATDGNQNAAGLNFPLPSSTAGALRAAWVDGAAHRVKKNDQTLLNLHVHGGLQALRRTGRTALEAYAPVPADVRLTGRMQRGWTWEALRPQPLPPGALCSLPHGLQPVRQLETQAESPPPNPWSMTQLQQWLLQEAPHALLQEDTVPPLQRDLREHVVIDPHTLSHQNQGYFQTEGLSFQHRRGEQGVVAWLQGTRSEAADGRLCRYGADGRAASFEAVPHSEAPWLQPEQALADALDALRQGDWFRLLLVTPACYLRNGWYPDAMQPTAQGQTTAPIEGPLVPLAAPPGGTPWRFRLRAAALPNWQPLAASNQRNATGEAGFTRRSLHRLVPAGSVYWLEIVQRGSVPLSQLWLQPTCRAEYARDGFGLVLPGLATGAYPELQK